MKMAAEVVTTKYFRVHFLALGIIGIDFYAKHPDTFLGKIKHFLQTSYNYFIQGTFVLLFVILEIIQTPLLLHNTDRLMASIGFTINHLNTFLRTVFFWSNGGDLYKMADILERGMRRYRQNEKLLRWSIRRSIVILFAFLCIVCTVVTCGTRNSIADSFVFVEATENVTVYLPYEVYSLWNPNPGWRYHLAKFYQVAGLFYGGLYVTVADGLVCAFLLHIRCQFMTLQESLSKVDVIAMRRLPERLHRTHSLYIDNSDSEYDLSEDSYNSANISRELRKTLSNYYTNDEIEYEISVYLKECIQHHSDIIHCVRLFESTYSVPLLSQFGISTLTVCSAIFQLAESELGSVKFTMGLFFFTHMILQLGLICLAGNEVTEQGLKVHTAVYRSQWVGSKGFGALKNGLDLRMIMMRAARPVRVTAAQFTTLSASTFLAVVKGAYSYYSVIKS